MHHSAPTFQLQQLSTFCCSVINCWVFILFSCLETTNTLWRAMLKVYSVFRAHLFGTDTQEQNFWELSIPSTSTRHISGLNKWDPGFCLFTHMLFPLRISLPLWGYFMDKEWPKVSSKAQVKVCFTLRAIFWGPSRMSQRLLLWL